MFFFFFNDPPSTEIYTLSLHDALPISHGSVRGNAARGRKRQHHPVPGPKPGGGDRQWHLAAAVRRKCRERARKLWRSEEHTSELQSRFDLVCRLLLEKKKKKYIEKQ